MDEWFDFWAKYYWYFHQWVLITSNKRSLFYETILKCLWNVSRKLEAPEKGEFEVNGLVSKSCLIYLRNTPIYGHWSILYSETVWKMVMFQKNMWQRPALELNFFNRWKCAHAFQIFCKESFDFDSAISCQSFGLS